MDISKISTSVLKDILKLTERRETLLGELQKIESLIGSLYGGGTAKTGRRGRPRKTAAVSVKAAPKGKKARRTGRRGALKDSILAALKAAGDKGVSVKELSSKLGVKNQNVHVWFSSTGRKLGTVVKTGPGRYRLKASA